MTGGSTIGCSSDRGHSANIKPGCLTRQQVAVRKRSRQAQQRTLQAQKVRGIPGCAWSGAADVKTFLKQMFSESFWPDGLVQSVLESSYNTSAC
jgi:hypothetical protein